MAGDGVGRGGVLCQGTWILFSVEGWPELAREVPVKQLYIPPLLGFMYYLSKAPSPLSGLGIKTWVNIFYRRSNPELEATSWYFSMFFSSSVSKTIFKVTFATSPTLSRCVFVVFNQSC